MTISVFRCPHCGVELGVSEENGGGDRGDLRAPPGMGYGYGGDLPGLAGLQRQPAGVYDYNFRTYNQGPGAAEVNAWREIRFEQPARAASVPSDVSVPALQAAITGLFVGAGALLAALFLTLRNGWAWYIPPAVGAGAWLLTAGVMWGNLLTDSRALLRRVESYIGRDLDGDGKVGPTVGIIVEAMDEKNGRMTRDPFTYPDEMGRIFTALEAGRIARISRPEIIGLGISDYKARAILSELKAGAFIDYPPSGATAGADLTARGRSLSRKLAHGAL